MKKVIAAGLALAVMATTPAYADSGDVAAGIVGGFIGGLIVGGAIAEDDYYYVPPPTPPVYYEPEYYEGYVPPPPPPRYYRPYVRPYPCCGGGGHGWRDWHGAYRDRYVYEDRRVVRRVDRRVDYRADRRVHRRHERRGGFYCGGQRKGC